MAVQRPGDGLIRERLPHAKCECAGDHAGNIRGIPSARYGDLTQGAIVVDTRAGAVAPALAARYDPRTLEASLVGGRALGGQHTVTVTGDVAHTRIAPGLRDDDAYRVATQIAHRARLGTQGADDASRADAPERLTLDTRLDFYQLRQDNPENPDVLRGRASSSQESGLRLSERARLALDGGSGLELTGSLSRTTQRSFVQSLRVRGATPVTDRLDEGRAFGRYLGGEYLSRLQLDGAPWLLYGRLEWDGTRRALGGEHRLRAGSELRREWNGGAGYQFDIAFPPQASFNGVQGFDRPRRFDAVPPVATTALYLDDRVQRSLGGGMTLDVQGGLRADLFHRGDWWLSRARDAVLQPRLNVQLTPRPWMRLRGGAGTTAKLPSLASLEPAPQYFDVVNVNWFTNAPAERLAVLTTFIRDPRDAGLGYSLTRKLEAGLEVDLGARGATLAVVGFDDQTRGAAGLDRQPGFILRDRFDFVDSSTGTGRPPTIIEPAARTDTIPILVDRPTDNLTLTNRGIELTASLPEWRAIRTRLEIQGAWTRSRLTTSGVEFALPGGFSTFQLDERFPRTPYWDGTARTGARTLFTYRVIHQQPELGLVVTGIVQHNVHDLQRDEAATDSLAFAGYVTRTGALVAVPRAERGRPEYADLQTRRSGLVTESEAARPDWLASVQVSKSLPLAGRLSFYGFNAFDRKGQFSRDRRQSRQYSPMRFGVEVTLPFAAFAGRTS